MNAAMALHVALSLRLDAIEAYRLAHAYRDEELQKFADRLASRATLYGDSRTVNEVIRDLRQLAGAKDSPTTATPEFFQAGRAYRSSSHADLRFECLALSADPDTGEQQAIGWRFGPPHNGVRRHRLAALGADDWACCDWTDTTNDTTTGDPA